MHTHHVAAHATITRGVRAPLTRVLPRLEIELRIDFLRSSVDVVVAMLSVTGITVTVLFFHLQHVLVKLYTRRGSEHC